MNRNIGKSVFFVLLLLFLVPSQLYSANTDDPDKQISPQEKEKIIQSKINELQQRIKNYTEAEKPEVAEGLNVDLTQLRERTNTLQETQALFNRQLMALRKNETILKEKAQLNESISTGKAFELEKSPPYSLKFYDDFTARLTERIRKQETSEIAVSVAEKSLQQARANQKVEGQQYREIKGEETSSLNAQETLLYQWRLAQAERKIELAKAAVEYHEYELSNAKLELELSKIRSKTDHQVLDRIRSNIYFDPADLEKQLEILEEKKNTLQAASKDIDRKLQKYASLQVRLQRKLERTQGDEQIVDAKAAFAAADQWRQTYQRKLEQQESILQLLDLHKQIWNQRYDLIRDSVTGDDLKEWEKNVKNHNDRLQRAISLEQGYQTNLQLQIGQIEEQLDRDDLTGELKKNLKDNHRALQFLAESTFDYLTFLNSTNQMSLRFLEEINLSQSDTSFSDKIQGVFLTVKSIWKFEVIAVDEQSITIGKIIIALFILVIGIIVTSLISRVLQRRILARLHMSTSTAAITGKLIHYFILFLVLLFAMRFVNIPLTAFTFLGGALAIGFGFGAQKLINNFISGFIIMAEQPIKVGDLVEMDNELGWIEDIGVRSTGVRTFSNIHILVPNSHFLENNITNWTHNNNVVRCTVTVGVAYGSPTREVKLLLLKAAKEHGDVMKDPPAYVLFSDFGDNALIFDLCFWVLIRQERGPMRIESDVRFIVDELFRESNITISFPQRDIHFDADKPLKIALSRDSKGQRTTKPET